MRMPRASSMAYKGLRNKEDAGAEPAEPTQAQAGVFSRVAAALKDAAEHPGMAVLGVHAPSQDQAAAVLK